MSDPARPSVEELDRRFQSLEPLRSLPAPGHWIRTIREGLGMSLEQLSRRAGVALDLLRALEEGAGGECCRLADYERVADALGCRLVCGLIPNQSFKELVECQARKLAERRIQTVAEVMSSQGQRLTPREIRHHIEAFANVLLAQPPQILWDFAPEGAESGGEA